MPDPISTYLALPELRAFWPFSSFDENNDARDLSGQGRTLVNNGDNSTRGIYDTMPYAEFFGSGVTAWFDRFSDAGLQHTGATTVGAWVWFDALANAQTALSRGSSADNTKPWLLFHPSATSLGAFRVGTGSTTISVSGGTISAGQWHLLIGRFTPSTELAVWVDETKATNTTSIPASLQSGDGTNVLEVAADYVGGAFGMRLDGRASLAFVCCAALSDALIDRIWQLTRGLFGRGLPSVTLTPNAVTAVGAKVEPGVVQGSMTVTPGSVSAVADRVNPTVILGAIILSPNAASAVGERAGPTVLYGATSVTPAPVTAIGAIVNPNVVLGSIALTPDAVTAVAAIVDPGVILGNVMVIPAAVEAVGDVVNPTVVQGSMSVTPAAVTVSGAIVNPTVLYGPVTVTPAPVWVTVAVSGTLLVPGEVEALFHLYVLVQALTLITPAAAMRLWGQIISFALESLEAIAQVHAPVEDFTLVRIDNDLILLPYISTFTVVNDAG